MSSYRPPATEHDPATGGHYSNPADPNPEAAPPVRHVYIDLEFMRNNLTRRGLVSLALTDDAGTDYYAINRDMKARPVRADPWMRANVWPYLPRTRAQYFPWLRRALVRLFPAHPGSLDRRHPDVRPYKVIRDEIAAYFADTTATTTYLYARNGAQDAVRLHGLWSHDWGVMPKAVPRWFFDIHALIAQAGNPLGIPEQETGAHHPLEDARHNRTVRQFLEAL